MNNDTTPRGNAQVEPPRLRLLRAVSRNDSLPTLGMSVAKVIEITSSGEDSVAKLAHFVLADLALTQKILRLANTVEYRSAFSVPVTTVSKAIFLLGFDTIKTSAMAMLLVDGFKDFSHAQIVRKELVHALCASIVARELAQRSHFHDAEEAAVVALFKNIGRVLVASLDHGLYLRIQSQGSANPAGQREAVNLLLGCSFERFGEQVLQSWKIPDIIVQSMASLSSNDYKKSTYRGDWLRQVASFSDLIADQMLVGSEGLLQRCEPAMQKFAKALEIDRSYLGELLAKVEQETRQLAKTMEITLPREIAGTVPDIPEEPEPELPDDMPSEFLLLSAEEILEEEPVRYASGKPINARDLLLAGVQDVTQMLASEQLRLNDLILLILETLSNSMGCRFACACLLDRAHQSFVARVAVGDNYQAIQQGFHFAMKTDKSLFHLAMANNADLVIANSSVQKIQDMLPAWHKQLLPDARSFIVLPLNLHQQACGLVYADRRLTAEEGVSSDETALIKTLKGQLLTALLRGLS
jgi:HD-like signal output (HDOD) protein